MKRTTIFMPEEMKDRLQKKANELGISFAELIRHIALNYIEGDNDA